jgi:hypothetical protein
VKRATFAAIGVGTALAGMVDLYGTILNVLLPIVSVVHKVEGIKASGEYVVVITWAGTNDSDVDLFGTVPNKKSPCFWQNRQVGNMYLDQDSKGWVDDRIVNGDGTFQYNLHREQMTIKGIVPGEYNFGIHLFNYHFHPEVAGSDAPGASNSKLDLKVHFEVTKVQPKPVVILEKDITLNFIGDATNVASIQVRPDGYTLSDPPIIPLSDNVYTKKTNSVKPLNWGDN